MGLMARLKQYIDYKGISQYQFCMDVGVSKPFLSKERAITTTALEKILIVYNDLNLNWLVTGQGVMILAQPNNSESQTHEKTTELLEANRILEKTIRDKNTIISLIQSDNERLNKKLATLA